jgi:hypothetical protein
LAILLAEAERRRRLTEAERELEQQRANEPALEEQRLYYEDSLYAFLKTAWRYMDPTPWVDGWCIEAIALHLQAVVDGDIRRLLINIPARTGKSSILATAFPAWCWAQREYTVTSGPGVRFLYASYAERLSLRDSVRCRRLIESPWYQALWGQRFNLAADQNTKHRFANNIGGERLITSIGQAASATGEGADIFCIDDANAANQALSEATIEATNDWWDQTASTRLNDPKLGAFINQQQRLGEDDLSGHILEKNIGEWTHLCLPMRYEADRSFVTVIDWKDPRTTEGELLWPERFGEEEVRVLEATMGPWAAAGQLQQRPEPKGGGVIKREWWKTWEEPAFPPMDFILASLDTAYTEKTINDFSALTVWGVFSSATKAMPGRIIDTDGRPVYIDRSFTDPAPNVMLMTAWQEHLELHDLVTKTAETCKKLKVDMLLIENKAAGISVAQEIRRL